MSLTPKQIQTAFGQRLVAIPGLPTVFWQNQGAQLPTKPYVEVQHVPASRADRTINGGNVVATGFFLVTVVTELDIFANSACDTAADIMAQFPQGWRSVVAGAGTLLSNRPAEDVPPFRQDHDWRQPVRVHYLTEKWRKITSGAPSISRRCCPRRTTKPDLRP